MDTVSTMTKKVNMPRTVESAADLVKNVGVTLEGVTFYRLSAELRDDLDVEDPEIGELIPHYSLRLLHDESEIGVRLALHLEAAIGRVDVDVAANYVTPSAISLPGDVHLEFANEVAIMALIPYIREAVWSMTQRVFGQAIVMPIFQRGEIAFTPDNERRDSSGRESAK